MIVDVASMWRSSNLSPLLRIFLSLDVLRFFLGIRHAFQTRIVRSQLPEMYWKRDIIRKYVVRKVLCDFLYSFWIFDLIRKELISFIQLRRYIYTRIKIINYCCYCFSGEECLLFLFYMSLHSPDSSPVRALLFSQRLCVLNWFEPDETDQVHTPYIQRKEKITYTKLTDSSFHVALSNAFISLSFGRNRSVSSKYLIVSSTPEMTAPLILSTHSDDTLPCTFNTCSHSFNPSED